MGGAVALAAMNDQALAVEGIVLVAPAIWSRNSMPFYQRWALWLAAHTMPSRELTGEGLDLHPSDNIEMLRAMGRDPLVIKATRVDVLYGVTNLMDAAASTDDVYPGRMLIQYGMKDDIIPLEPTCQWLNSLAAGNESHRQILIYKNGYHMLTRDLQADVVLDDLAQWILEPGITLGHDGLIPAERFCK
jgi:alpha-beta hydrolase superfamily lysophospholipase